MQERLEAYFADKEEALVAAVSRLIRIPSVGAPAQEGMPFGPACKAVLDEALQISADWGLPAQSLDGYVGVVDLNDAPCALHILAHLDVVAALEGWTVTEAFTPKRIGDLLYGRGASDDKGPLIAALLALRAVRDLQLPLSKNVRLILGTDEESGFRDIEWYYARHPYAPFAFSPDASFPVTNLEKGHLQPHLRKTWSASAARPQLLALTGSPQVNMVPSTAHAHLHSIPAAQLQPLLDKTAQALGVSFEARHEGETLSLLCRGKSTHASTPEEGTNALTALLQLLVQLPLADCAGTRTLAALARHFPHGDHSGAALGLAQADALSGDLTLTFSMMDWQADGFSARFDARTPLSATVASTRDAARARLAFDGIALEGELSPAHYVPADSPFLQTLLACYERYSARPGFCESMGGGTYVHDIPGGVAFGACMPGFDSHLHGPDERVSISELLCAAKIFAHAIATLCA